jgi:hypothetical protein
MQCLYHIHQLDTIVNLISEYTTKTAGVSCASNKPDKTNHSSRLCRRILRHLRHSRHRFRAHANNISPPALPPFPLFFPLLHFPPTGILRRPPCKLVLRHLRQINCLLPRRGEGEELLQEILAFLLQILLSFPLMRFLFGERLVQPCQRRLAG